MKCVWPVVNENTWIRGPKSMNTTLPNRSVGRPKLCSSRIFSPPLPVSGFAPSTPVWTTWAFGCGGAAGAGAAGGAAAGCDADGGAGANRGTTASSDAGACARALPAHSARLAQLIQANRLDDVPIVLII